MRSPRPRSWASASQLTRNSQRFACQRACTLSALGQPYGQNLITSGEATAKVRANAASRLVAVIACAALGVAAAGCASGPSIQATAATRFLSTYVRPDGQVVRLDQGRDTVSEGQAYGMLLAEGLGDYGALHRIWKWTHEHLQLSNGLFAFHANPAGTVISPNPASDADLLIAWALLRYRGPGAAALHLDGHRVADAILAQEVVPGPGGTLVLTAGPWAGGPPATLDPSYWSLPAFEGLAQLTGNSQWHRLAAGAMSLTLALTHDGRLLPPDWAVLSPSGSDPAVQPEPAPDGSAPYVQYGPDADRAVVWFATSCNPRARALAARWWLLLGVHHRARAFALSLDGAVLNPVKGPVPLVASASAAKAAGNGAAAQRLLREAVAQQTSYPTYYGGAWVALGLALLDTRALGAC
jgi:endoglucanase